MNDVLTLVLAGGKGTRLEPLTRDRAKPAVPFGGLYRIIDFTLSNCINSGLRKMLVLTQYKARSLDRHLAAGWNFLSRQLDEYVEVLPPQQRIDENWYKGTADAIYQNIYTIEKADPTLRRDPGRRPHLQDGLRRHDPRAHRTRGRPDHRLHPRAARRRRPVRHHGRRCRRAACVGFVEKPADPPAMPGDPDQCLASMGIYVFTARTAVRAALPGRHPRRTATTTSATTSSRRMLGTRIGSSPTASATATARPCPTGATWARSTPITRPTWT